MVNNKYVSCSPVVVIPTEEWYYLPYPKLMFCQNSSQEVLHTEPITDEIKQSFSHKKRNANVIPVGYNIMADAEEARIVKNWYLLDNKSTFNAFINGKSMSNVRNYRDRKYLHAHCNEVVTYTNKIDYITEYSNPVWYNPKEIANIMSLSLVQKHHLVTYNSQHGN